MWQEIFGHKIEQIVIMISSDDGAVQAFTESPINYVKSLKVCIEEYMEAILDNRTTL